MSIPITDKLKPKGAGGYPLMDAEDILMPDGTRLSELDLDLKIATYDLVAMGLPNLNAEGEVLRFEADTAELMETLATSIVTIIVNIAYRGMVLKNIKATFPPNCNVATVDLIGHKAYVTLYITEGQVSIFAALADRLPLCSEADNGKILKVVNGAWAAADKDAIPTSIDMSSFESEGKIVETFADGSTETTVMEFDADGKPTKITDGNGNVTVLTW